MRAFVPCSLWLQVGIMIFHNALCLWRPQTLPTYTIQPPLATNISPLKDLKVHELPCVQAHIRFTLQPMQGQLVSELIPVSKLLFWTCLPLLKGHSANYFSWLLAILRRKQDTAWDKVLTKCLWQATNEETL
jgi:hypothetical protein